MDKAEWAWWFAPIILAPGKQTSNFMKFTGRQHSSMVCSKPSGRPWLQKHDDWLKLTYVCRFSLPPSASLPEHVHGDYQMRLSCPIRGKKQKQKQKSDFFLFKQEAWVLHHQWKWIFVQIIFSPHSVWWPRLLALLNVPIEQMYSNLDNIQNLYWIR